MITNTIATELTLTSHQITLVVTPKIGEPDIVISPSELNFGDVVVGSDSTRSITVSNNGSADLSVTSASLTGSNDFTLISGGGSFTLASGETRNVEVRFSPGSMGNKAGTFRIINNFSSSNVNTINI